MYRGGSAMKLTEWFDTYRLQRMRGAASKSLQDYHAALRGFAEFLGRDPTIQDLTDTEVAAYLVWLSAPTTDRKPAGPRTRNKHRACLLALWRFARLPRSRYILGDSAPEWDPCVERETVPRRIPEAWTATDVVSLIRSATNQSGRVGEVGAADWWQALISVCYWTGWRLGAVLELPATALEVFHGATPTGAVAALVVRAETQKQRADQTALLDRAALEVLKRIRPGHADKLFPWPWCRLTLHRHMRRILAAAGVTTTRFLFHKLRATHATLLEAAGGNATEALGHSDRRVTVAHYIDRRLLPVTATCAVLPQIHKRTDLPGSRKQINASPTGAETPRNNGCLRGGMEVGEDIQGWDFV